MIRDNPYNKFVELIREEGAYNNTKGVIIGEVKSLSPLLVNIGKIDLYKENLYISSFLLGNYSRNISFNTSFKTVQNDTFNGNLTGQMSITDIGLKVGDKVALMQMNNQIDFLIIDKVVRV